MTVIIELLESDTYNGEHYGITHRSRYVYHVTGPKLHNPSAPHRLKVWDNTRRQNNAPDEYAPNRGKPGPGAYLNPDGKGTDEAASFLLSAEATVITNTGTVASGQVYAPETLKVGGFVVLRYPGGRLSDPYRVTPRFLADPELTPAVMDSRPPALAEALDRSYQTADLSWTEVDGLRRHANQMHGWAIDWQAEWINSRRRQGIPFTKWDLLSRKERAELDVTPFLRPGTKELGACGGCGEPLPTEGAFARHFIVPNPHLYNVGYCPNNKP